MRFIRPSLRPAHAMSAGGITAGRIAVGATAAWALTLLVWLLLTGPAAAQGTAEQGALVSELVPPAQLRRTAEAPWERLTVGTRVRQGQQIRTGLEGRVELTLAAQRVLRIGPATEITVPRLHLGEQTFNVRIRLVAGRVWGNLLRVLRPAWQEHLVVSTPTATVGIKGTQFGLEHDPTQETLRLLVLRGQVAALPPGADPGAPKEVPGPREVAPPQEISEEAWEILVTSRQRLVLRPGEPPRLEPVRPAHLEDAWVAYNIARDAAMEAESIGE